MKGKNVVKKMPNCEFGTYGIMESIIKGTLYIQQPEITPTEKTTQKKIMPQTSRKRI